MFKESFKYYKSKNPEPCLDEVIDIYNKTEQLLKNSEIKILPVRDCPTSYGLKCVTKWEIYEINERPGLIYIKNPFVSQGQRYWTIQCLKTYSSKTFKRNIDPFNFIPDNREWWEYAQENRDILEKLRWSTLGYHHDWNTKVYTEQNRGEFPEDLSNLTNVIANVLGYSRFKPEAAIINYYPMGSTLSGHTDHSEHYLDAPLFSFSFGQTAIFLLGGETKNEKPVALFLKSGDIVVMSKESRLAYHGVPKILLNDENSWNFINDVEQLDTFLKESDELEVLSDQSQWKPFDDYLKTHRININVRQVLHYNQRKLEK